MKKIFNKGLSFAMAGLMIFSLSTCKKSDSTSTTTNNNTNNTVSPYYFTCKVNGVAKDLKSLTLIKDPVINPQTLYLTSAINSAGGFPLMRYTLNYKGTGFVNGLSYTLNDMDLTNFCEYTSEGGSNIFKSIATPHDNNGGLTITFTTIDSCATGTFSGTLQLEENTSTITITEGKFRMRFLN